MLLTVSWPTKRSSEVTTNGSRTPARADRRTEDSSDGHAAAECRERHDSVEVGSHGASHSSLRNRRPLHADASRSRGGRSPTRSWLSRAGHPGWRVIAGCHAPLGLGESARAPLLIWLSLPSATAARASGRSAQA